MKTKDILLLLVVITIGATIANLVALKIAADQVQGSVSGNPLFALFKPKSSS